jgi:hypothetical protein
MDRRPLRGGRAGGQVRGDPGGFAGPGGVDEAVPDRDVLVDHAAGDALSDDLGQGGEDAGWQRRTVVHTGLFSS